MGARDPRAPRTSPLLRSAAVLCGRSDITVPFPVTGGYLRARDPPGLLVSAALVAAGAFVYAPCATTSS